jgi:hypothetical protein
MAEERHKTGMVMERLKQRLEEAFIAKRNDKVN